MAFKKTKSPTSDLDCTLSQDCLDYLKINKQPFSADILTDSTFLTFPALDKIIENLHHQVQFSDLLLVIEGPFGSGKTSLFRQLIHTEIENTKSLAIQAEATDTLIQIQQKMSMHLQDLGNANYLDDNLKSLQSFDQIPLAIIDNAHVLSDTTIQELFRYKDQIKLEHDVNLKFILFASNGIANTLQKITTLQENQMYVQAMPTYTGTLAQELIAHKLRIAGYTGEALLTEKEYQLADNKSDGTPLNLMHHISILIEKNIAHKLNPPTALWIKSLVGIAALIIISIAAGIYLNLFDTKESSLETAQITEPTLYLKDTHSPEPVEQTDAASDETSEPLIENNDVIPDQSLPVADNDAMLEPVVENKNKPTTDILTVKTPPPIQTEALPKTPVVKPTVEPVVDTKPQLTDIAPIKTAPIIKTVSSKKIITKPLHPALMQLNKMKLRDASWLLKQKSTGWTLQLLGAREPETLLSFSRQHQLGNAAIWYKTWLKGQPYYVLIYGNYTSRDNARIAISKLPEKLQAIKPWVKSIKSVQDAIK